MSKAFKRRPQSPGNWDASPVSGPEAIDLARYRSSPPDMRQRFARAVSPAGHDDGLRLQAGGRGFESDRLHGLEIPAEHCRCSITGRHCRARIVLHGACIGRSRRASVTYSWRRLIPAGVEAAARAGMVATTLARRSAPRATSAIDPGTAGWGTA